MVGFLTLLDFPRWQMRAPSDLLFFWCGYLYWQEPSACASTRVQAGRQRILSEASGCEVELFETHFPQLCV